MLYIMLSGVHPFDGSNYIEILNKTMFSKLEFSPKNSWINISE